eukprot:1780757-Pyramimonas_sp.AAC.1
MQRHQNSFRDSWLSRNVLANGRYAGFERQVPRGRERPSTYTHTRKHVRAERSPECTTYTPPKRCNADTCVMPTFITANLRGRVRGLFVPFNLANLQQFVRTTLQTAVQRCNSTR